MDSSGRDAEKVDDKKSTHEAKLTTNHSTKLDISILNFDESGSKFNDCLNLTSVFKS
jgi:hypothetical protein